MNFNYAEIAKAYKEISEAVERFHPIYYKACCETSLSLRKQHGGMLPFRLYSIPEGNVDCFDLESDGVIIFTYDWSDGDRDEVSYKIPVEALEYTDEQIQEFANQRVTQEYELKIKEFEKEKQAKANRQEEKERAEFERLKAKFEPS